MRPWGCEPTDEFAGPTIAALDQPHRSELVLERVSSMTSERKHAMFQSTSIATGMLLIDRCMDDHRWFSRHCRSCASHRRVVAPYLPSQPGPA